VPWKVQRAYARVRAVGVARVFECGGDVWEGKSEIASASQNNGWARRHSAPGVLKNCLCPAAAQSRPGQDSTYFGRRSDSHSTSLTVDQPVRVCFFDVA
jgi:hypothetical protein